MLTGSLEPVELVWIHPCSILRTGGRFIITRSHDSWIRIGRSTNWPTQMYWTSFGGVGMNPGSTTKEAVVEVCLDDSAQK